jgi:hypothetical protein
MSGNHPAKFWNLPLPQRLQPLSAVVFAGGLHDCDQKISSMAFLGGLPHQRIILPAAGAPLCPGLQIITGAF